MNGNVDVGRRFFWGVPFKKNWHYALLNFGKFYPRVPLGACGLLLVGVAKHKRNNTQSGEKTGGLIYVIVIGFAID